MSGAATGGESTQPAGRTTGADARRRTGPTVLGVHEYADTAIGLVSVDAAAKAAPVEIVTVRVVNPGKLVMAITGDEAAVELGLVASSRVAGDYLLDELFLPAVHFAVVAALRESAWDRWDALAILECATVTTGIAVADIAAKRAAVDIAEIRFDDSMGGRSSVRLLGPIGEIDVAVAAAAEYATRHGTLVRTVTIPNPHDDLRVHLTGGRSEDAW